MNEDTPFCFEVQSGLYAGLRGDISAGARLIGSSLDADFVFVEQGLEPHHLRVALADGSIEIEALGGDVDIEEMGKIAAGERRSVPLPVIIHLGAMSIRWSMTVEAQAVAARHPRLRSAPIVVSAAFGFMALTLAISAIGHEAGGDVSLAPSAAALTRTLATKWPDDQSASAAARALRSEVEKAGLLNIRVDSGPGIVAAEGTVEPSLKNEWQKLQHWFDHSSNGALTLVNGVVVKEEKPPPPIAIEAVWRGTQPYLLVRGQKYFVGAMLEDGWTIHKIEETRVLLSRSGRFAAVPY